MSGSASGGQSETLREFLIRIGYQVDGKSEKNFTEGLGNATKRVGALVAALQAATAALVAFSARMSRAFEDLYYASQRTGATVQSINALTYAASQMGTSAQDARASLEGLAQRLRTNPGYGGFVRSLIGQNADLSDTSKIMDQLAARFRQMPYYLAVANAQALGISEDTLRAMIAGMDRFNADYRRRLQVFGVDTERAAVAGRDFMRVFRETGSNLEMLATKVFLAIGPRLTEGFRKFNEFLERNGKRISEIMTSLGNALLTASDVIFRVLERIGSAMEGLYEWFQRAEPATQKLVTALALVTGGLLLLNTAFLASPIGRIVALTAAIAALWEDYQTWKEGGESLIDWSKWEPSIQAALQGIEWVRNALVGDDGLLKDVDLLKTALIGLAVYMGTTWVAAFVGAIGTASRALMGSALWRLLSSRLFLGLGAIWMAGGFGNRANADAAETEARGIDHEQAQRMMEAPSARSPDTNEDGSPRSKPLWDRFLELLQVPGERGRRENEELARRRRDQEQRDHEKRTEELQRDQTESLMSMLRRIFGFDDGSTQQPNDGGGAGYASRGADESPLPPGERRERAGRLGRDLMRDLGLTREQAAGIVGHGLTESRLEAVNERNPLVPGSRGGFGYMQWTGPRRVAFEAFARQRGLDVTSYDANYQFLVHELRNTPHGRASLEAIRSARDPAAAMRQFIPFLSGGDSRWHANLPARTVNSGRAFEAIGAGPNPPVAPGTVAPVPGGGLVINQTTQITVNGASSPTAVGAEVASRQRDVNADLARNTGGAVR